MEVRENENIIRPDMIQLLMQAKKGTLQNEENNTANGTSTKPSELYLLIFISLYHYMEYK